MPAKYADLGKKADDLFNKGFEHGKYKLEVVSKSSGHEITTKGHQDISSGAITATHEHKISCGKTGTAFKSTFTPGKDALACELESAHEALKGAKVTACFSAPLNGCPKPNFSQVKLAWSNDCLNFNANSSFANTVNFDAVFKGCAKTKNCAFGIKSGVNYKDLAVTSKEVKFNANIGSLDYTLKTGLNNDWHASIHNQINSKFALATVCNLSPKGNSVAIAGKSAGCCGSSNQFKLCNGGKLALSHITPLACGGILTASAEFDATNFAGGNHKVGAGLKFTF